MRTTGIGCYLRLEKIKKMSPATNVFESRLEWLRLRQHGVGMPKAIRLEKLENPAAWGGESGRGPARGEGGRRGTGAGWGCRNSEIQIFKKRTPRKLRQAAKNDPTRSLDPG